MEAERRAKDLLGKAQKARFRWQLWERWFQYLGLLMNHWPKSASAVIGVAGGGGGWVAGKSWIAAPSAIVAGLSGSLKATSFDAANRHNFHQRRRIAYGSLATIIDQRLSESNPITDDETREWTARLNTLSGWIFEAESTWVVS